LKAKEHASRFELRLFVAGMGPRSTQAVADIKRLCGKYGDHCRVEIVDLYQHPGAASEAQIVAVPTLARERPLPRRQVVGTITNIDQVARSLGLVPNRATGANRGTDGELA